jgi:hypothetical protein
MSIFLIHKPLCTTVARFFVVQYTKKGENIPHDPNIYQSAIKYTKWPEN